MSNTFYLSLFDFLDNHNIDYSCQSNIVRFKAFDFSFFLVNESDKNTYTHFIEKRKEEQDAYNSYLIFIWFDLWESKPKVVLSKLTHLFGLSTKLHARKTKVEFIDKAECQLFFTNNHLNQPVIGYKRIGLSIDNNLVALASFAKRRKFRDGTYSAELLQFSTLNNHHINGGLSKIIKHFTKRHPIDSLMTYIDLDWSTGEKFKKIGFKIDSQRDYVNFELEPNTKQRRVITNSNSYIFNTGSQKALIHF